MLLFILFNKDTSARSNTIMPFLAKIGIYKYKFLKKAQNQGTRG